MPRKSSTPLALHEVIRIIGAEHAYLFLGAENSEQLVLRSARDAEGHELSDPRGSSPEVVERVRMSREPLAVSGASDGSAELDGNPLPPRHMLAAPLLLGHRLFGVIYLDRGLARAAFTEGDVEILTAIADHLALALESAHTERLARSQEAALHANRAKSAFIAHMSHELRTPLTAIIGYSELLEEEFQDRGDATYIPDVQRIQSAAKHLLALINNMLDLSKIEAGKMELYLEEFALAEVVEEAVTTVLPLLERGGNPLHPQLPGRAGAVPPRPDEGPPGAAEPARQRGEVHGGGPDRARGVPGGGGRGGGGGGGARGAAGLGHGHRDVAGADQADLRGVRPGQRRDDPAVRGDGARPGNLAVFASACAETSRWPAASARARRSRFACRRRWPTPRAGGAETEAPGDDPRYAEAPLDLEEAPDDASSSMRSGVFPWPV
jgi:signal transduction histidine kinase